jgi:DNA-binding CsgD family transcriptional regulator/tetratricopeptide (TPR) repeat protein
VVEREAMPHEVAAALVKELRARGPAVFVLEDVHWADEATLDVLRLLARRVESVPALVVATYRDELDRTHPLRLVLGEVATGGAVRRLKLAPLSRRAVEELARPHDVDADELYDKTGGNPFFVVEALAAGAAHIPDTVRDAVLARAAQLGNDARALLEAVAVAAPRAELWLLEAIAADVLGALEECVAGGILAAGGASVSFRHELARLAVEESIALDRKVELHRRTLAALAEPPAGKPDSARLSHHADAAGDVDAVVRFAPLAAARAAALGAHREAAAQYARALRFSDRLSLEERAELAEARSRACYLTDQSDAAVEAIEDALRCRRSLGRALEEGNSLRWLSQILWCPGRTADSERTGREAVALLETLPPSRELAEAYANLAAITGAGARRDDAIWWGVQALELAEQLGDAEIAVNALGALGIVEPWEHGRAKLERCLERAQRAGLVEQTGRTYVLLAAAASHARAHAAARRYTKAGLEFCSEMGLELFRAYVLAYRARSELDQGRWDDATESASAVLRAERTSVTPGIVASTVIGLVRARRGDPDPRTPLDDAWRLAEPTAELPRLGPVAVARAEAAWLAGDAGGVDAATAGVLPLALGLDPRLLAELVTWRRRAGLEPDGGGAATDWAALGCPYEAALARADSGGDDDLRLALDELQELGAHAAAAIVMRRLRELGARGVRRGPRPATRSNPAGLTARELEVLALLTDGLRNAEIASRLVVSQRTVGHHVGAILRKLDVQTRMQAGAEATRRGIVAPR